MNYHSQLSDFDSFIYHLLSIYIYKSDCLYLCPSFTLKLPYQYPPNFVQTSPPTQGRFLTQVSPCQPNSLSPGYPKLQNLSRSRAKKLCVMQNVQMGTLKIFLSCAALGLGWLCIKKSARETLFDSGSIFH